jgi:vesicle coat complex subunit
MCQRTCRMFRPSSHPSAPFSPTIDMDNLISDPRDYLKHVMKSTNMSCLTPEGAMSGECDFLSANMYARSLFGQSIF